MWRPYKHVTSAYRSVSIPRPYLSTAQACYRKEISPPFTFSNSTLAVGCEEVRGAQARGPDRLRAESPVPGDLPTHSCRVPLGTAPPPQRRQPLFPALAAEAFLRPNATQTQQRTSPSTSASGLLNYKSRQAPREARPLPPPPEKNPRTLREMPGPRNRTKPAEGGGEVGVAKDTRDGGLFEGAESPIWLSVFPCPSPNCRARRPRPVPRASGRSRGRPPGFFADSCQAVCSPQASVPLTPFPPLAQTSGSGTTAASLARTASGLWAPGGGGRRSPTLPWRCAPGRGKGCPMTMTALRLCLASRLPPPVSQPSGFRLKDKEKKEFCH